MTPEEVEDHLARLHPESYGWALSCCGYDEVAAEDILQTTYLRIVAGRARFGGRSAFRTWLFGVIRRVAQEERRRRSRREARTTGLEVVEGRRGADPHDPVEAVARDELREHLQAALARLSERQREVLHLVFYESLTVAEAADVMEVSVGSARTHYHRGKERMRELLDEETIRG
jgi:RNA polymerase sigma-70 factor (ECF subfamily)